VKSKNLKILAKFKKDDYLSHYDTSVCMQSDDEKHLRN
jgi:hypothetical protein